MIKRGYNTAGLTQYTLPAACNRLGADRFFITDNAQYDLGFCNQFAGERVLWLTKMHDARGTPTWFKPNAKTQVNIWNEEEWWSHGEFTPTIATPRLVTQIEQVEQVDPTAIISVQIGVQWNAVGWAKTFGREEWFAPIWRGLPNYAKDKIDMFNVHFYEPSGNTNITPVLDFLISVRSWMDKNGAGSKKIRIGEIGLDKIFYKDAESLRRAESYPKRIFEKLENKSQELGLGIEDIFFYCAGAYPALGVDSQFISLVDFGTDQLTNYGKSFADRT